jgi:hypothetical protein
MLALDLHNWRFRLNLHGNVLFKTWIQVGPLIYCRVRPNPIYAGD